MFEKADSWDHLLGVSWGSGAHVFTPPPAFTDYVTAHLSYGLRF